MFDDPVRRRERIRLIYGAPLAMSVVLISQAPQLPATGARTLALTLLASGLPFFAMAILVPEVAVPDVGRRYGFAGFAAMFLIIASLAAWLFGTAAWLFALAPVAAVVFFLVSVCLMPFATSVMGKIRKHEHDYEADGP